MTPAGSLYMRRCRKHRLNLEEFGEELHCPAPPAGHICDDFQVIDRKTGTVVNEVPEEEGAAVSQQREKANGRGSKPFSVSGRRGVSARGELKPHGTHQRYFQKCRCQPCKDAANQYSREKRHARLRAAGKTPKTIGPRTEKKPRRAAAAIARVSTAVTPTPFATAARTLSASADVIIALREQLTRREAEFATHVSSLLPGWKLFPAVDAEVIEASISSKGRRRT